MSRNSKLYRERREKKQKQQGEAIVKWIFAALIFLAIIYIIYTFMMI